MYRLESQAQDTGQYPLFISLAEQLHLSFLQITRLSETAQTTEQIHAIAEAAMQFTENYILSVKLHSNAMQPLVEPTSLYSILLDVSHNLQPLASAYGVQLSLGDMGRLSPVMTDATIMRSILTSIGQVFIVSESQSEEPRPLQLSAHMTKHGVVTGLYSTSADLSKSTLRRAHALQHKATQPFRSFVTGPATGVFVAEQLLESIYASLHVGKYHNMSGLAVTIPVCRQMQLV